MAIDLARQKPPKTRPHASPPTPRQMTTGATRQKIPAIEAQYKSHSAPHERGGGGLDNGKSGENISGCPRPLEWPPGSPAGGGTQSGASFVTIDPATFTTYPYCGAASRYSMANDW